MDIQSDTTLEVTSAAIEAGKAIPKEYTAEGKDISPPLSWSGAPDGVKSFAVIADDPDAPSPEKPAAQPWVHWVLYNIPADAEGLPRGIPRDAELEEPAGARQGKNSWPSGNVGYRGPKPPAGSGAHRYFFKVYALDKTLNLPAGQPNKAALLSAMQGHVLARGELMGKYEIK